MKRIVSSGASTYRRMKELAAKDPDIAGRLDLYHHRVLEELYDVESDPDCLKKPRQGSCPRQGTGLDAEGS